MMGFRDPAGGAGIYPRPDMYPAHQFGGYFRQPGMMDDRGMGGDTKMDQQRTAGAEWMVQKVGKIAGECEGGLAATVVVIRVGHLHRT